MNRNNPGLKTFTASQAKDIDRRVRADLGISTLILMENAGRQVAGEICKKVNKKPVAFFCGKGNNGGDGFVAARHILAYGIKSAIFLAGEIGEVKNEAKINLDILLRLQQKVIEVDPQNLHLVRSRISNYGLIVDALLGVGLSGQVRGVCKDLISLINFSQVDVLSIDIPSGLDATSGKVLGCCVAADKTITFVARKRGMVVGDGPKYCGEIIVVDLGVPLNILNS